MWLMNYITQNSLDAPSAVKGDVNLRGSRVSASGEHGNLQSCAPYGVLSVPPKGSCAVVLPLDYGEVNLGVVSGVPELEEGELMLFSSGGASIVLKNNGKVLINGREV